MSVTTVSFAHTTLPSETYLTELGSSGPPYTVHGVALGAGDVTRGASGVKKKWPASELQDAADTLEGTNLVVDHENNADGVVGQVRKAGYKDGTGVIYEAELYEEELADKIDNGLLEVSIRGYHADVEELDEDEDTGALIVKDITFDNLSIVPQGASPSNTLQMGEHEELSAAALQQFTASLVQDPEPGMWVAYDGTHGITIGQPQNGQIEVDVYEEQDGQWRSTGETEMVATDDLGEWDVEESDIGPVSAEENEPLIEAGQQFFSTVNNSTLTIEAVDGNIVTVSAGPNSQWKETMEDVIKSLADGDWQHAGHVETGSAEMVDPPDWTEGDMVRWQVNPSMVGMIVHNPRDEPFVMVEVMENGEPTGHTLTAGVGDLVPLDSEEMADAKFTRGDWVEWDTRNSTEVGTVVGGYTKGEEMPDFRGSRGLSPDEGEILYALRMYDERDGTYHPIEGKPIGHYENAVRSAEEPANVSDEYVELADWSGHTREIQSLAMLAGEPLVDRPTGGERRATFHTPLTGDFTESAVMDAVSIAEDELGVDVSVTMTEEGVFVEPIPDTGVGAIEFMHPHLDVIESSFDNTTDIEQKSTLFIGGDADGYSMQPCFMMESRLSDEALDEIARLYKFVTGVDANLYYAENRLYFDTGQNQLAHGNLDVAEILVRRAADDSEIGIQSHSFKVLEETSSELGRSNHEQYDVDAEEWVQWYPSDMTEEHGFVLDVDESAGGEDEAIVTIEVWTQNSDGEWETDGEEITKPMALVEPWGNFPRKQEEFADAIADGDPRKAVQPSDEENAASDELISEQVKDTLREKAEKHNEEHGDEEGKEITYRMLKNVFERGMGAYQDSHREGMTPQQWSYARVNAFLYLVRNGQPENDAYTQDNDLLPEAHPKYNETDEEENASFEQALTTADVIADTVFGEHDPMGSDEDGFVSDTVERVVTAELVGSMEELDEVYSEWADTVNMTASELQEWSGHPCSREASLEPVAVMERNLELLETNKSDWTTGHIEDAKRTISFINRMRGADTADKTGGPHGCPSKRDISLLNWAYNPFDEVPAVPEDEALDSVEELYVNDRGEGEETVVQTLQDKIDLMRQSPERSTPQEVAREQDEHEDEYLAADEGETHLGEASDVASLAEYEMHEVEYEGTHSNEWNSPDLEEFVDAMDIEESINEYDDLTTQAKRDVASAFIISASGFPADDYGDLKLPVVEPSGELSRRALAAVKGGHGVSAVSGLDESMETEITNYVNQLAEDEFDANWAEQEETNMPKHYGGEEDDQMMGDVPDDHMFESRSAAEDKAEDMGISGAHKMGEMYVPGSSHDEYAEAVAEMNTSTTARSTGGRSGGVTVGLPTTGDSTVRITTMNDELEAQLSELDSPVAVEAAELEALEQKADRLDTMSESLEELRERTSVLDEVDQAALEELREADDPVVVESDEHEALESEAAQVKGVYAASLAEEYPAFDEEELSDRYSIDELREKFEAEIGSVEEELTADSSAAEPRSQDPSEEELAGDSEDDVSETVAQKQEELRDKILS